MKKLFAILLCSLVLSVHVYTNDLYLYDAAEKVELNEVINNKLNVLPTVVGKTFTLTNGLSVNTSTNANTTYVLPHRIAVYQKDSGAAYFSAGQIEYTNDFVLPAVVNVKDHVFNFSYQGELYCVSESSKQSTIGTSMNMIVFDRTKLFVKAGDKFTHVYVLEGTATVLDNKSKKKKVLKAGDYLVITPQATLSPREATVTSLGNSFSIKEVEDVERDAHAAEIKTLQSKLDNVLFVNYGTNIFGVKLHP
jgi:hypothetical protein